MSAPDAFWRRKRLSQMTLDEWESLCDGCGKCCLQKLEDAAGGAILYTNVACKLLNLNTCRCTDYANRCRRVPDCLDLKTDRLDRLHWMPATCAYRLLLEGKDLPPWHPLRSGTAESVHAAGVSVRSYALSESDAGDLEEHVMAGLR